MSSLYCYVLFWEILLLDTKYMIWLFSFSECVMMMLPAFTYVRAIGNLWSISSGISIWNAMPFYFLLKLNNFSTISITLTGFSFCGIYLLLTVLF